MDQSGTAGSAFYIDTALYVLQSLRPSFLTRSPARTTRLRRTAWLDGLRGFAAFLVYVQHNELWAHEGDDSERKMQSSYGYRGERWFCTLPIVRVFFTGGHLAVAIFFIVSGYVLSAKPLALVYAGDHAALSDALASAFFRRWFRLYLPIVVVTFIMCSWYHWTGILTPFIPEATWGQEVWKWYAELKTYTFIYGAPKQPWFSYQPHTWTIPIEMRGSLLVWMTVLSLSRTNRKGRLFGVGFMIWYCMYIVDGSFFSLFLTGLLLCDLDMHEAPEYYPDWVVSLKPYETPIAYFALIVGLCVGGVPSFIPEMDYFRENPGWRFLSHFKPQAVFDFKWFFLFWAGILIILSVQRIPWAKRFCETRFCLYLGRVSYMLYLVHGPVLWTLGDRVYAAVGLGRTAQSLVLPHWTNRFPLPKWGPMGLEVNFLMTQLILMPVTFWLADVGTTFVDGPAIKFGTWLYAQFVPPTPRSQIPK